mmetsp:Transcript_47319/g.119184  ORF Transcript_47319/g.119184 Transcript_47319/m.119184 type:complete len:225 (-) Transcript_47319:717-1391(-)
MFCLKAPCLFLSFKDLQSFMRSSIWPETLRYLAVGSALRSRSKRSSGSKSSSPSESDPSQYCIAHRRLKSTCASLSLLGLAGSATFGVAACLGTPSSSSSRSFSSAPSSPSAASSASSPSASSASSSSAAAASSASSAWAPAAEPRSPPAGFSFRGCCTLPPFLRSLFLSLSASNAATDSGGASGSSAAAAAASWSPTDSPPNCRGNSSRGRLTRSISRAARWS